LTNLSISYLNRIVGNRELIFQHIPERRQVFPGVAVLKNLKMDALQEELRVNK
jgi:ABC-type branched-subunit amino acid transport system ATPase component